MKRLRNSIRDLFWLALLLSALAGWWADRKYLVGELNWANDDKARVESDKNAIATDYTKTLNQLHELRDAKSNR